MPTQDTRSQVARKVSFAIQLLREAAELMESSPRATPTRRSKAAVTPGQLRELTRIALRIANKMLLARGRNEHVFNELPRDDAEAMLKALAQAAQ
jgi:hypothetical protein